MLNTVDRVLIVIYIILAGCLVLVSAQAIVTMRDVSIDLQQGRVSHEEILKQSRQALKDHEQIMKQLTLQR